MAEETIRDYIVAAARYLNNSEWKKALDTVMEIAALKRLPEYTDGTLSKNLTSAF